MDLKTHPLGAARAWADPSRPGNRSDLRLFIFVADIAAALYGGGMLFVQVMSPIHIGYSPTLAGSIAGAVWAPADGLVAGILIAWLYNLFPRTGR